VKALVVNALGSGFELEDIDITTPIGRGAPGRLAQSGRHYFVLKNSKS
jgi:hypothetical protein